MAEEKQSWDEGAPLERVIFEINEVKSPEATRALSAGLTGLNGVHDVQFVGDGAMVTFSPLGITKEEICTALQRGGYRATEVETSPDQLRIFGAE